MIPKDKEPTIIKNNTIAYEADSKAQTNIVITKIFISKWMFPATIQKRFKPIAVID